MSRPTVAFLSKKNLLHNVAALRQRVASAQFIAVVKANAYGHGIRTVSRTLEGAVDGFAVASIDEALILRRAGIQSPIILLQGIYGPEELQIAYEERLEVVLHQPEQFYWLRKQHSLTSLSCWIKVNTGLGRLGLPLHGVAPFYDLLHELPYVEHPIKFLSHFSCSQEKNHPLNRIQVDCFRDLMHTYPGKYSLCNSGGILHFPEYAFDAVRSGICLYGISPVPGMTGQDWGLKPVMTLRSHLIAIQNAKRGDPIGYGGRFCCPEDMPVGILAFGYGDGYPSTARDGTPVLVRNHLCSLIGTVSMDMMAIDLRPCPDVNIGEPVTLWGPGLPVETVMAHGEHHVWQGVTGIQNRVKFIWEEAPPAPMLSLVSAVTDAALQ